MTPRDLDRLLHSAAAAPVSPSLTSRDQARAVWARLARGWDPERIEWQRWLRRWWPWVILTVFAAAGLVAALPHGDHLRPETEPPVMEVFQQAAGSPDKVSPR